MARYATTVESSLAQREAFDYMADFVHVPEWDPATTESRRLSEGPIEHGARFRVVTRFGGHDVELEYTIVELEPPSLVVLEALRPRFVSRDTVTVRPQGPGSTVHYDAKLAPRGAARLLDPFLQVLFTRIGERARAGLERALNP